LSRPSETEIRQQYPKITRINIEARSIRGVSKPADPVGPQRRTLHNL
jgi:hypothetical protein